MHNLGTSGISTWVLAFSTMCSTWIICILIKKKAFFPPEISLILIPTFPFGPCFFLPACLLSWPRSVGDGDQRWRSRESQKSGHRMKEQRVLGDVSYSTDQVEVLTLYFKALLPGVPKCPVPLSCLDHGLHTVFIAGTVLQTLLCCVLPTCVIEI